MENETAGIATNWRQTEWEQEKRFSELGPFHHLYTEPQESTIQVAYVIRNPYVVRRDVNPLAYEWTSGFLYFNPMLRLLNPFPVQSLTDGLSVLGDYPYPGSFVNFRLVESLFQDARQFTMCLFKNMEAQVETALQLGERPSLTDDDLLPVSLRLCKELSGSNRLSNLSEAHKLQLAKRLKYDYYASNKQVARFSGLPLARVNALFPLAAPSPGKTRP